MEDYIAIGAGRCEECLRKLVFMIRCNALGCERWVCEHKLVKKELGTVDFLVCSEGWGGGGATKSLEIEFCSEECSCELVDEYLVRRKYSLQSKVV